MTYRHTNLNNRGHIHRHDKRLIRIRYTKEWSYKKRKVKTSRGTINSQSEYGLEFDNFEKALKSPQVRHQNDNMKKIISTATSSQQISGKNAER